MKRTKSFVSILLAAAITLSALCCCVFSAGAVTQYYGDADCDGTISAADARIVLRVAVKLETHNAAQLFRYDVNGDSQIASDDARAVLRMAVSIDALKVYIPGSSAGSGSDSSNDTANAALIQSINKQIGYFSDGDFYMEAATVEADGTITSPMTIACKGDSVFFSSDLEGINIGILTIGTEKNQSMYMISDSKKAYLKLTDKNLSAIGISKSDLSFEMSFDETSVEGLPYTVAKSGNDYIATFTQSDGSKYVITTNSKGIISRLAFFDASGNKGSDMMIYDIQDTAPESRITVPKTYRQYYTMLMFFAAIAT